MSTSPTRMCGATSATGPRWYRTFGVGVAVLLLVAACSSGDDDEKADTSTTEAPVTTTTEATTTTTVDLQSRPPAPASAEEVAEDVAASEAVLRDLALPVDDARVARAGHVQQVAYRALAEHPEWDAGVGELLPPDLRASAAANASANRELRSLVRTPRAELPAWRIVDPAPADELRRYYDEAEERFGVAWEYLAAVHLVESRMGRLRGTSTAGARGPMQFLPATWDAYGMGGDIESNRDAILGAANYLRANGAADGRMDNALYRYNPTDKYVRAVTAYAEQMVNDERAYRGYYHWQVYYWSTLGDVWLRVGYEATERRPVTPADLD